MSPRSRFILSLLTGLTVASSATARDEVFLTVGQQQLITQSQGRRIDRVAVGNATVLNVRAMKDGAELLVTGKAPGSSDLTFWYGRGKKSFTIHVFAANVPQLFPSLREFLGEMEGIRVRQAGREIWIEGEVLRPADRFAIRRLAESNPLIRDMTTMDEAVLRMTQEQIVALVAEQGYRNLRVTRAGESLFIDGTVNSAFELKKLEKTLQPLYPGLEYRIDTLFGDGEMILMDVKMVEMRKQALHKLGIEWQKSATLAFNGGIGNAGSRADLGLAEAVPVTINSLSQQGLARILSNPRLSCRYDVACNFQAGGEIPIPLIGERSVNVIFKNYGVQLNLVTHLAADSMLVVEIDAEFSDVNYATAVNGIPGLLKNSLKTTASVRFNQSIVLSGLVNYRQGKNVDKLPMLGSIPIFGELFKSRSFNEDQSEFILFLTPLPMLAGDDNSERLIDSKSQAFDKLGEAIPYAIGD